MEAQAVIPSKQDWKAPIPHDEEMYRWRHRVEKYFSKIKDFRAVNTRYDKTDIRFVATVNLAASIIVMR